MPFADSVQEATLIEVTKREQVAHAICRKMKLRVRIADFFDKIILTETRWVNHSVVVFFNFKVVVTDDTLEDESVRSDLHNFAW